MDRAVLDLFHEYRHTPMERRVFLERLAKLAGGAAAAAALIPLLEGNPEAALVSPEDPRLITETVRFSGPAGEIRAYQARLKDKAGAKIPAVLVIHENRGLNPHNQDVVRRAALAGYHALAPDLLSRKGGTPSAQQEAIAATRTLTPADTVADLKAALAYLGGRADVRGDRLGVVGFCWGGGMTNRLATAAPELRAAVAFYGPVPPLSDVPKIKAHLLLMYAGNDQWVNKGIDGYKKALDGAGITYEMKMYPGVEHAFHNDTGGVRYNAEAAKDAWSRALALFAKRLQ